MHVQRKIYVLTMALIKSEHVCTGVSGHVGTTERSARVFYTTMQTEDADGRIWTDADAFLEDDVRNQIN